MRDTGFIRFTQYSSSSGVEMSRDERSEQKGPD